MMVCQSGRTGRLTPGSDRLGVKPLSFAQTAYGTLFGSEPKAILAHPQWRAELDAEGMAAAAFLLDVNEWLTEYRVSLV